MHNQTSLAMKICWFINSHICLYHFFKRLSTQCGNESNVNVEILNASYVWITTKALAPEAYDGEIEPNQLFSLCFSLVVFLDLQRARVCFDVFEWRRWMASGRALHKGQGGDGAQAFAQMAHCHRDLVSTCSRGTLSGNRRRNRDRHSLAHRATPSPWQLMSLLPA